MQACIAALFELSIEAVPDLHSSGDQGLNRWLSIHYPGVEVRSLDIVPVSPLRDPEFRVPSRGWWMATVESPRFTEKCAYHVVPGGEPLPPFWYHELECPHCGGSGVRPGYHAIVCKGASVEHDPHPDCDGYGWEYVGRLVQHTTFHVIDPARLSVRLTP